MDWGTLVQEIIEESGRPSSETTRVKLKLCDAIAKHRAEHFWFNEVAWSFNLVAGTDSYGEATVGFPAGLVTIPRGSVYVDLAGSASSRYDLRAVSIEHLEALRASGPFSGEPDTWAFYAGKLELYPTPSSAADVLRGRAIVDRWNPIKKYSGGAWKFYKPLTTSFVVGNELTDAYPSAPDENPWVTEAADMIRAYALYLLWSQVWQATDDQAQRAMQFYLEARASHEDRTRSMTAPPRVEPYSGVVSE